MTKELTPFAKLQNTLTEKLKEDFDIDYIFLLYCPPTSNNAFVI